MSAGSFLSRLEPEAIPFPFSRLYSAISGTGIFRDFYETVARQVCQRVQAGRVLDVGTGPGKLPVLIAGKNPLLRITGLDLSADMVKIAAAKAAQAGAKNADFREGSASLLPFADSEFSLVISTLSFHHWKEPQKALDEIYRVLRDGGEAWIYDVPRRIPPVAFEELKRRYGFVSAWLFRLHAYTEPFYTEKQVVEVAADSRFKRHEIGRVGMTYRLTLFK